VHRFPRPNSEVQAQLVDVGVAACSMQGYMTAAHLSWIAVPLVQQSCIHLHYGGFLVLNICLAALLL
jgi:hypothetical protein